MDKRPLIPLTFHVTIEEKLFQPPTRRWHVQFMFHPFGYFRAQSKTPAQALSVAWKKFRKEVDPGKRWWSVVQSGVPLPRM